ERLMTAVHRYEGTVNQVMGDGIMALFGAPLAHEDHAMRACYAALAMQEAMRHYSAEVRRTHGVEVQIRVGLHSGEVVVRAIGNDLHMDYSAIGQTTHLAARMEQLATPGSIRLTAETLRLAEGLIQVTALGPVPVKGLAEPVEVFELVGASALRRRLQAAAARGLTRFVGRQPELEALRQALARAGTGHRQVVAIVAEAGWASPAWRMSVSTPTASRSGWCSKAPQCPTARRRPISRSLTCSSATSTSRGATTCAPSGPRSPGMCSPWTRPSRRPSRRCCRCWRPCQMTARF